MLIYRLIRLTNLIFISIIVYLRDFLNQEQKLGTLRGRPISGPKVGNWPGQGKGQAYEREHYWGESKFEKCTYFFI